MNRTTCIQHAKRLALGLAVLAIAATPSFAQTTIDLCATTGNAEVTPGNLVPIWGYILGSTCTPGDATLPNPVIRATAGETLTINLTNNLGEAVSFFVPGLPGTATGGVAGVFTREAASLGTVSYTFTPDAGTYLYQSATSRIRTQVPMGLYGALVVDMAPGEAYPGVLYDQDEVLVYSTIDPALNADPDNYGGARVSKNILPVADEGRVYGWLPQYFLINGKAFPSTETIAISAGAAVLLRFVNAGLDTAVPTLDGGLYMDLIAEDGNLLPVPFSQYGLELQPGKTFDALINVSVEGTYPLYDRALNLTNGTATGGGMLVYLDSAPTPIANPDPYAGTEDTQIIVAAPGVLTNDLESDGVTPLASPPYTASLVSDVSNGTLALAADGSFTYTPDLNFYGADSFSYRAVDLVTPGSPSNVATVTLTVDPVPDGGVPSANPQTVTALLNTPVAINLTGSDPEGDVLSFAITSAPVNGVLSGTPPAVTYTPNLGYVGSDSFNFTVSDSISVSTEATVTINVPVTLSFSTAGNDPVPGVPGTPDNADIYRWDGSAFSRVVDAQGTGSLGLALGADVDGLVMVDATHFYLSFVVLTTAVPGLGDVQDEDIVYYDNGTWSVYFDGTAAGLTGDNLDIDAFDIVGGVLYFSTFGNTNPPGVTGTADDADIYSWNGTTFARVVDVTTLGMTAGAGVDGLEFIDSTHFYLSVNNNAGTTVGTLGTVQDEDIVYYSSGTWSLYFDGSTQGLTTNNLDIDAFQVP